MAQSQVQRPIDFSQSAFFTAINSMAGWLREQLAWEAPPSVQTQHQHHKHNHNHKHAHNHGVQDAYLLRNRELPSVFTSQDCRNALEYWGRRCAVCERPRGLWHTLSQDHWIPLSSPDCPGTDPTNILPLCCGTDGCNNSKGRSLPDVWLERKLGKRRAGRKLAEIEGYFNWVRDLKGPRLGCPQCGGRVNYVSEWRSWHCERCDVAWDKHDARGYENCPKCQCWMIGCDGSYLCPRCNLECDRNNLPTCEECPNCCAGSLRWIYKLGEACGLWRCTGCRAEWVFE